jgi:hypothetical protein
LLLVFSDLKPEPANLRKVEARRHSGFVNKK